MNNRIKCWLKAVPVRYVVGCLIVCASIFGLIALYNVSGVGYEDIFRTTELETGWNITYDGKTYSNVNLEEFKTSHAMSRGDVIVLNNRIPEDWEYSSPVLCVHTHNSVISVNINGSKVYQYGQEPYACGKPVGSGYHYIDMKSYHKGKIIKIKLTAAEFSSFSSIDTISITDYPNVYKQLMMNRRVPYVAGNFLVLFGIIMAGISGILFIKKPEMFRLLWVGLLSVCVGGWTLCYYRLAQMYGIPLAYCSFMEHVCLYIGIIPVMMYFKDYVWELNNRVMKRLFCGIVVSECIYTAIMLVLHFTDCFHLPSGLPLVHIFMFVVFAYITVLMIMGIRDGNTAGKLIRAGYFLLMGFILVDAAGYISHKYMGNNKVNKTGLSVIGNVLFIAFLFLNFGVEIAGKLKIATEKEVLYRMAYTDMLTQLNNRRYCEELMEKLSASKEIYGIYSLDLNDLKTINDTCGHHIGDELISGFADILQKTFSDIGRVGRMGGDEFIVVIENAAHFDWKSGIEQLKKNMAEANQAERRFQYSVAFGYADSREITVQSGRADSKKVYTLADNRMYECKKMFKNNQPFFN